ncbi:hypothetical protein FISHEDRAFT_57220 [Fistulina hepatica ATCC 64428]|nr:hypothetical protein FISHEDRAFT_57220 [Fistulina hepatica ATCC 64428]
MHFKIASMWEKMSSRSKSLQKGSKVVDTPPTPTSPSPITTFYPRMLIPKFSFPLQQGSRRARYTKTVTSSISFDHDLDFMCGGEGQFSSLTPPRMSALAPTYSDTAVHELDVSIDPFVWRRNLTDLENIDDIQYFINESGDRSRPGSVASTGSLRQVSACHRPSYRIVNDGQVAEIVVPQPDFSIPSSRSHLRIATTS